MESWRASFFICAAMSVRAFARVGARCSLRPVWSMKLMSAVRMLSGVWLLSVLMKRAIMPLVMSESESAW